MDMSWFTDVLKAIGYPNVLGLRTSQMSSSECWNSEVSARVADGHCCRSDDGIFRNLLFAERVI